MSEPLFERGELAGLLRDGLSVEAIARKAGRHPSTVAYWMKKFGLDAPLRDKYAAKGGLGREELTALVEQGLSGQEVADRLGRSASTVRYWLRRYGLRTGSGAVPGQASALADTDDARPMRHCRRHGMTDFVREGSGYLRCVACRAEGVVRRRRKVKEILVHEAGGKCVVCGYDRSVRALEFHHLDPTTKRLAISGHGMALALSTLRAEASKCVLLCSNCHAEVEDGTVELPLEFPDGDGEEGR